MKIKAVRVYRKDLAMIKPYTIAFKTISSVENIFLELELENGMVGIGAANPSSEVVGETPDQTFSNLQLDFVHDLVGRDIRHAFQMMDESKVRFPNLPGTQAAIDIALHDAFGKYLGIPIVEFYGHKIQSLPTSITIGIKNTEEALREAEGYYQQGFRIIKVKLGSNVEEDIERILKLHETFKGKLTIRVDANQGYSLADVRRFIAQTKKAEVELIEQPLPVGQEKELLKLSPAHRKLLAADESLKGAEYALRYSQSPQPFGIFNIKLMICGGIKGAMEIATIARLAHIDLFWGCNDESIVSISAALHAAFANVNTKYIDLDGSFDLGEDVVRGGFVVEEGVMRPVGGAGLGLNPVKSKGFDK